MFVLTAKVSKPKIILVIVGAVALIALIVMAVTGLGRTETPAKPGVADGSTNEARLDFLSRYGWDVNAEPVQTRSITIPTDESDAVYARYNALQKSQGFDLTQYAGKNATQYVYEVITEEAQSAPVYATLIVFDRVIIGGDVTDTAQGGLMHGFQKP